MSGHEPRHRHPPEPVRDGARGPGRGRRAARRPVEGAGVGQSDHRIPRLYQRLEAHGVVDNFRGEERRGFWFSDSDLYKWIEAAAWSLAGSPDAELDARLRDVSRASRPRSAPTATSTRPSVPTSGSPTSSGRTSCTAPVTSSRPPSPAPACQRPRTLLDAARRFARSRGGRARRHRRARRDRCLARPRLTDAHPGIETALVELYRETGRSGTSRSRRRCANGSISRPTRADHGHAVPRNYSAAGLADLRARTGDEETIATLDRLWVSMIEERSYVTGAVGGRWIGGVVRPALRAARTKARRRACARSGSCSGRGGCSRTGVRNVHRTSGARLLPSSRFLAGVSLARRRAVLRGPLAASSAPERIPGRSTRSRSTWPARSRSPAFRGENVTCCPPNVACLLASLPGYCYGESDRGSGPPVRRSRCPGRRPRPRAAHRLPVGGPGRAPRRARAGRLDPDAERSIFLESGLVEPHRGGGERRRGRRVRCRAVPRDHRALVDGDRS